MKKIKLYNIIFPLWFLMFLPPVVLVTLVGNYLIDSLVVIGCFYAYKLVDRGFSLKKFYKENILKVWGFGFLADFIGALVIFALNYIEGVFKINIEWIDQINFDPFSNIFSLIAVLVCIAISGFFIYYFNYKFVYNKIEDKALRHKLALTLAIITMPWTFLIPSKILYRNHL